MFVSAILGYLWISEEVLGFDLTILDDGGRYIQIQRDGQTGRLGLEELTKRSAPSLVGQPLAGEVPWETNQAANL